MSSFYDFISIKNYKLKKLFKQIFKNIKIFFFKYQQKNLIIKKNCVVCYCIIKNN